MYGTDPAELHADLNALVTGRGPLIIPTSTYVNLSVCLINCRRKAKSIHSLYCHMVTSASTRNLAGMYVPG